MPSTGKPRTELLDWLYPPICALCECGLAGGRALCGFCAAGMPRVAAPFCSVCCEVFQGRIDGSFECPNCRGISFHFDFARAAMDRSDETLDLIHRLKYGRELPLARELGDLATEAFCDPRMEIPLREKWPLVPVPLHWSRQRERQFNQAQEIARAVSRATGLPLVSLLKRVRRTETQTRLSRQERLKNLKGAFAIRWWHRAALRKRPPGSILVDDVFTTGSTVDACAKVLRKAGVQRVVVLTVMRG